MLTIEDLDILTEALSAWESKDDMGEMAGELIGAMLCKDDPAAKQKMEGDLAKRKAKFQTMKARRAEDSVLIKSKLIQMKRGISHH